MKYFILFALTIFVNGFVKAQPQANFYCTGTGFDAGCGGFADSSVPNSSTIIYWHWDFGNGDTSNIQNPENICYDSIGTYTVCLTVYDSSGGNNTMCKQSYMTRDSLGTHCTPFSGVNNISEYEIAIYPNPINDKLNLESGTGELFEVSIIDITSRLIRKEVFRNKIVVKTDDLSSGIYLCRLVNNHGRVIVKKVVKY